MMSKACGATVVEGLRPWLTKGEPCRVLHIGDGAHARTAALFSLKSDADNISIDPLVNVRLVAQWRDRFDVRHFAWRKAHVEEVIDELNALPPMRVLLTFVHAHVQLDKILDRLRWDAAFTLACCLPGQQLTQTRVPLEAGMDWGVLSEGRRYQVLVNRRSPSV